MLWFKPTQQLSPTQLLTHSPQWDEGEELEGVKVRNHVEIKSVNEIKQKPCLQAEQNGEFIQVQPCPGKQSSITPNSYLGGENPNTHPLPSSSPALYTEYDITCSGIPLGQLGAAVPAVSLSSFLCTPSLLAGVME